MRASQGSQRSRAPARTAAGRNHKARGRLLALHACHLWELPAKRPVEPWSHFWWARTSIRREGRKRTHWKPAECSAVPQTSIKRQQKPKKRNKPKATSLMSPAQFLLPLHGPAAPPPQHPPNFPLRPASQQSLRDITLLSLFSCTEETAFPHVTRPPISPCSKTSINQRDHSKM